MPNVGRTLPEPLIRAYLERQDIIRQRLREFAAVPPSEWFYETAFCLLTPQSKAVHAHGAVEELKGRRFLQAPFDPVEILLTPSRYIRFHRVKADRLLHLQQHWPEIERVIAEAVHENSRQGRDELAARIPGMGLKEASHVLRNIGCRGLAIIDRHLIRCLAECGVIPADQRVHTRRAYHRVENLFEEYSRDVGIDMDELDLLFWSEIAGLVLK